MEIIWPTEVILDIQLPFNRGHLVPIFEHLQYNTRTLHTDALISPQSYKLDIPSSILQKLKLKPKSLTHAFSTGTIASPRWKNSSDVTRKPQILQWLVVLQSPTLPPIKSYCLLINFSHGELKFFFLAGAMILKRFRNTGLKHSSM